MMGGAGGRRGHGAGARRQTRAVGRCEGYLASTTLLEAVCSKTICDKSSHFFPTGFSASER
jgi:hypothetical protein